MTVDTSKATYSFFAYARGGVASGITATFDPSLPTQPTSSLALDVSGAQTASATVGIYGPGDVVAIDAKQITRVEPKPDTPAWTPNWFCLIEFDRPDYPWLFSPYAPSGSRLLPWLVLIVVEDGPGVTYVERHETSQRPALTLTAAAMATELPDLADTWAWAYVQVAGDLAGSKLDDEQEHNPERVVSRIVSPRRLAADSSYRACLVPAYEAGRAAGMGEPTVASTLEPAWKDGLPGVTLPVYHSWRFSTGPEGDFAALARRLTAIKTPAGLGERALDAHHPGGGMPSPGPLLGGMQGALMPPVGRLGRGPTETFKQHLRSLLDSAEPDASAPARPLEMPPPIYGRWQAGLATVPPWPPRRGAGWLTELNLDPRFRAAAAVGTELVRRRQQQLMTSAWAQVGKIDRANQAMHQAQLARQAAGATFASRFKAMSSSAHLVLLCAPALPRVRATATTGSTLWSQAAGSRAVPGLSPAFRRLTRPRGPLARRTDPVGRLAGALDRLNSDASAVRPLRTAPDGTQMVDLLAGTTPGEVAGGNPGAVPRGEDKLSGVEFQTAAEAVQGDQEGWGQHPEPGPAPAVNLGAMAKILKLRLDPEQALPPRVASRVTVPPERGWDPADPLDPIMAAPEFPTPMFLALRELGQDYVLPGLDKVPPDTVTLVKANNRFVNSFMIGLNHEMSRQLLWRGYPTDQRGTYFRQFWDPVTPGAYDLEPLHTWPRTRSLGKADGAAADGGDLVLVVRGELLRRFPDAIVSVVEAKAGTPLSLGTAERLPVFTGTLAPDVTFLGFDLSEQEALTGGSDGVGWFFVLQQHATEPHFGLAEELAPGSNPATWADLGWGQLAEHESDFEAMTYAPATPPSTATPTDTTAPAWGTHAADMAAVSLRDPVRIAIHASQLIR
jgi:hypothetical protein